MKSIEQPLYKKNIYSLCKWGKHNINYFRGKCGLLLYKYTYLAQTIFILS